MPTPVLTILKFCLVAIIYLFLARVLRAVWVEITTDRAPAGTVASTASNPVMASTSILATPPTTRKDRKAQRQRQPALKVLEPIEQLGTLYPMVEEMTLGRAPGCAIQIQDTFASQLHARVFQRDSQWFVEDLGSTNGTWVNRSRVHGPAKLVTGDRLKVGDTILEVTA
jgi:FHA domain